MTRKKQVEALDEDQSSLLAEIRNFNSKIKPQNPEKKQNKKYILNNLYGRFDGRERVLDAFGSGIFPIKIEGTGFCDLPNVAKVPDHT